MTSDMGIFENGAFRGDEGDRKAVDQISMDNAI